MQGKLECFQFCAGVEFREGLRLLCCRALGSWSAFLKPAFLEFPEEPFLPHIPLCSCCSPLAEIIDLDAKLFSCVTYVVPRFVFSSALAQLDGMAADIFVHIADCIGTQPQARGSRFGTSLGHLISIFKGSFLRLLDRLGTLLAS